MDKALSLEAILGLLYCQSITGICGQSSQGKGTMQIGSSQNLHRGPLGPLVNMLMSSSRLSKITSRKRSDTEK